MSRYTSVRELAAFLHCEALAMLWSYFDESGTHGDSRVTCIAGYVGAEDEWTHVESQWQAILEPYGPQGLTWWHSSDKVGKKGVFENINTPTKNDIERALIEVVKNSELQVIWNAIDTADFEKFVVPQFNGRDPFKPYDLCFYWIIRQLQFWRSENGCSERIGTMFALQDEYNERSDMALNSWQSWGLLRALGPLSFDSPQCVPALQPADMLGNEMYRCWLKVTQGATKEFVVSDRLRDLSRNGLKHGGFATGESLANVLTDEAWNNPPFRRVS